MIIHWRAIEQEEGAPNHKDAGCTQVVENEIPLRRAWKPHKNENCNIPRPPLATNETVRITEPAKNWRSEEWNGVRYVHTT